MAKAKNHLASIDLFSALSAAELRKIDSLMTTLDIKAGREFIKEGSSGREAFIIVSGTATVRKGGRVVATLRAGDFVGEMAVVAGIPRTASVTANEDLVVEVLSRREFATLLDNDTKLCKKIMVSALTRLHELAPSIAG